MRVQPAASIQVMKFQPVRCDGVEALVAGEPAVHDDQIVCRQRRGHGIEDGCDVTAVL